MEGLLHFFPREIFHSGTIFGGRSQCHNELARTFPLAVLELKIALPSNGNPPMNDNEEVSSIDGFCRSKIPFLQGRGDSPSDLEEGRFLESFVTYISGVEFALHHHESRRASTRRVSLGEVFLCGSRNVCHGVVCEEIRSELQGEKRKQ
jgi:hypothetical protein